VNGWEILGLAPTADMSAIKKAYAGKTKLYHPEDDPQGFQRLREAYEFALKQAKYMKNMELADHYETHETTKVIDVKEKLLAVETNSASECIIETNSPLENLVEQFMSRVKELYSNEILRKDMYQWKELLEDDAYWNLDIKQKLNYNMLHFLLDQYQTSQYRLPPTVWKLFDQHFFWTGQQKGLYESFPEEFIDFAMDRIHYKKVPLYRIIMNKAKKYAHVFYTVFFVIVIAILGIGLYSADRAGAIIITLIIVFSKILQGIFNQ
jgi:hypothetical protein